MSLTATPARSPKMTLPSSRSPKMTLPSSHSSEYFLGKSEFMRDIGKSIASEVPLRPNLATIRQQVETEEYAAMRATTRPSTSAAAERGGGSRMANNLNRPSDSFYRPRKNGCRAMFTSGAQLGGRPISSTEGTMHADMFFGVAKVRRAAVCSLDARARGRFFSPPPPAPARAARTQPWASQWELHCPSRTADRGSNFFKTTVPPASSQMARESARLGRLGS